MKLTWLGHSCFVLEQDGYRIVLDPYFVETYPVLHVSAHEILCSHDHRDHCFTEAVMPLHDGKKNPFAVEIVETFHDEKQGMLGLGGGKSFKSWVLLADYYDETMLRNWMAFRLGDALLENKWFSADATHCAARRSVVSQTE